MITLVLLICVMFAVYLKFSERYRRTLAMVADIPTYPGGLPLIGHGHLFLGLDGQGTFETMKKILDYGVQNGTDFVKVSLKMRPHIGVLDPDDCWTLFNESLDKGYMYKFLSPWLGDGLFTADAVIWHPNRKMLSPAFNPGVISSFQSVFERKSRVLADNLMPHVGQGPFNVGKYMETHFLETVYETVLGSSEDEAIDGDYAKYTRQVCDIAVKRTLNTYFHFDFIFNLSQLKQDQDVAVKLLHKASNKVIEQRKSEYINNNNDSDWTGKKFKPFLKHILELSCDKGAFQEDGVRQEVDTIILAGQDTSALVMQYAMILLGSHHHVQEKVYAEIKELLLHEDREVTKEDLIKMKYIEAVINETLRLYPIGAFVPRDVNKDIKLRNRTLPAGSTVFLSVWHIHRSKQWGPDAETFRPERWLDTASLPDLRTHFGGFSIGKRNCIGKHYAMCAMKTAMVHLIRKYRLDCKEWAKLKISVDFMIRPIAGNLITVEVR